MTIQKLSPSESYLVTAFAEPTGLFSVFGVVAVDISVTPVSFLGEQHSLAQWPGLPQLWHLPFFLPFQSMDPVAARALSMPSFFAALPFWLCMPPPQQFFMLLSFHTDVINKGVGVDRGLRVESHGGEELSGKLRQHLRDAFQYGALVVFLGYADARCC